MEQTNCEDVDFCGVLDNAEPGCSKTIDAKIENEENTEVTEDAISNPSRKISKKSKRVASEKLSRFRALERRLNELQEMQKQLMKSRKRCNIVESSESENEPLPSQTDDDGVPPKISKIFKIDVSGKKRAYKRIPKLKLPIIRESEFEDDTGEDDHRQHSTAIPLQRSTAIPRQQRTANSPQLSTAISQQHNTATSSSQVPSVSLGDSSIYDRVTLLPSDDNLEASADEKHDDNNTAPVSNEEGSIYDNLELPYNAWCSD